MASGVAPLEPLADLRYLERDLRHEDLRRSSGDARVRGDPARVAAHHLADDDAMVRLGGGAEAVDRVSGYLDGGVEAERELRLREVVVDRLRDADGLDPVGGEAVGHTERVLSSDGDDRVEVVRDERPDHLVGSFARDEGIRPRGAEDGSTHLDDVSAPFLVEQDAVVVEHSAPTIQEADYVVSVDSAGAQDHCADYRVQSWAVAPACEDPDAHLSHRRDRGPTPRASWRAAPP